MSFVVHVYLFNGLAFVTLNDKDIQANAFSINDLSDTYGIYNRSVTKLTKPNRFMATEIENSILLL